MRYFEINRLGVYWCLVVVLSFLVLTGSSCRKDKKQEEGGQNVSGTATKSPGEVSAQEPNTAPVNQQKTGSGSAGLHEEASKHPETGETVEEPEQAQEPVRGPLAEWAAAGDTDSKLDVLEDLVFSDASSDEVISVIEEALDDSDPNVRLSAIEALGDYEQDESSGNRIVELISRALTDENENVRFAAMSAAQEQEAADKLRILGAAISSAYNDVKLDAVSELSDMSSPAAMDVLIKGLKDNNTEFREEVSTAIYFLIDEQFDNYRQAEQWWKANRHRFDEKLVEKED
jgi:hypothetical protein